VALLSYMLFIEVLAGELALERPYLERMKQTLDSWRYGPEGILLFSCTHTPRTEDPASYQGVTHL
jgi:hypothetical protein